MVISSDSHRDNGKELSEKGVVGLDSLSLPDGGGGGGGRGGGTMGTESGGETTADLLARTGQAGGKPRENSNC